MVSGVSYAHSIRDYRELYEKVPDKIDKLGPQYALDKAWLDACDKKAAQTQERLENELNSSRTALLKENIRVRDSWEILSAHSR